MADGADPRRWHGGLDFAKQGHVTKDICRVHLNANFALPPDPSPTVVGWQKEFPEDHLDLSGPCFFMRFSESQVDKTCQEKNFIELLKRLAGHTPGAAGQGKTTF
eukprot:scaffold150785_cov29-Prasinocladus_malaysianus.AAC.3